MQLVVQLGERPVGLHQLALVLRADYLLALLQNADTIIQLFGSSDPAASPHQPADSQFGELDQPIKYLLIHISTILYAIPQQRLLAVLL